MENRSQPPPSDGPVPLLLGGSVLLRTGQSARVAEQDLTVELLGMESGTRDWGEHSGQRESEHCTITIAVSRGADTYRLSGEASRYVHARDPGDLAKRWRMYGLDIEVAKYGEGTVVLKIATDLDKPPAAAPERPTNKGPQPRRVRFDFPSRPPGAAFNEPFTLSPGGSVAVADTGLEVRLFSVHDGRVDVDVVVDRDRHFRQTVDVPAPGAGEGAELRCKGRCRLLLRHAAGGQATFVAQRARVLAELGRAFLLPVRGVGELPAEGLVVELCGIHTHSIGHTGEASEGEYQSATIRVTRGGETIESDSHGRNGTCEAFGYEISHAATGRKAFITVRRRGT